MKSETTGYRDSRLILPFVLFVITTIYLFSAFQITPQVDEGLVGPSFIPVLASLLMYIALGFVVREILLERKNQKEEKQSIWVLTQMVIATAVYILVFKIFGYLISTFVYVYVLLYVFDLKESNQFKRVLYSAIIAGVFYVLYSVIFQVRLPIFKGIL
jgi:putative tricarboxylic transport membrane protein